MTLQATADIKARQKAAVTREERRKADLKAWIAALSADIHNAVLVRRTYANHDLVRWEFMMKGDDDMAHLLCVFNVKQRAYYLYVLGQIVTPHDLVPFTDAIVALLPQEEKAVAIAAAMGRR